MEKKLQPGLHVAATPIGNLGDITKRVIDALAQADRILCEDTRITGKLLNVLGIPKRPLLPYHEHNAAEVRPQILSELASGAAIVLVSDAGTPLISDPGYRIVREARDAGHKVYALPGPSALTAALSIAGAPTDRFTFLGFPPKGPGQIRSFFEELSGRPETLVLYESGPRLAATLAALAETLGPRTVAVARELTKLHEEIAEGDAAELAAQYEKAAPKGEIVLIIHPASAAEGPDLDETLRRLLKTESVREAAKTAAEITGKPKKECYARALELKEA
ncbi:16S rRNA (cytidine(1402)-2'-O)-methyltransferase [Parvularcula lutaonensis]|uniref:Ribosomal RNA small subunit methyltransferase I n=1 Tax=Parvularcula lutaonensis TaxID=491923 RepID=A0ABV7MCA2_9PROT|nr:16S rRNA (cytidine(1402)-2'-O)-methyltransferase [Parvularcula lutaonensis]GGY37490.1 ribosomal RNA small subunit methyltransferase I [Parvularcula lutaonensis]